MFQNQSFRTLDRHIGNSCLNSRKAPKPLPFRQTLSSLQFRQCSVEEEGRGCERWLVTSATPMPVHQVPPDSDYWARENARKPKP